MNDLNNLVFTENINIEDLIKSMDITRAMSILKRQISSTQSKQPSPRVQKILREKIIESRSIIGLGNYLSNFSNDQFILREFDPTTDEFVALLNKNCYLLLNANDMFDIDDFNIRQQDLIINNILLDDREDNSEIFKYYLSIFNNIDINQLNINTQRKLIEYLENEFLLKEINTTVSIQIFHILKKYPKLLSFDIEKCKDTLKDKIPTPQKKSSIFINNK